MQIFQKLHIECFYSGSDWWTVRSWWWLSGDSGDKGLHCLSSAERRLQAAQVQWVILHRLLSQEPGTMKIRSHHSHGHRLRESGGESYLSWDLRDREESGQSLESAASAASVLVSKLQCYKKPQQLDTTRGTGATLHWATGYIRIQCVLRSHTGIMLDCNQWSVHI